MPAIPDLSVQLYSVREPLGKDFSGTLGRLADIGLTQVEPYGLLNNAENLRSGLTANGLTAPTAHQALDTGNLDEIFQIAAELGIGTVIHPYTPADSWRTQIGRRTGRRHPEPRRRRRGRPRSTRCLPQP